MKILVVGDIHGNLNIKPELKTELDSADLLFLNGDITDFGGASDFEDILDDLKEITTARILGVPGNCDTPEVLLELERKGMNLHANGEVIDDIGLMGVGGSNPTPFSTPMEFTENDISSFLDEAWEEVKRTYNVILISHFPPKDTESDVIESGVHVGSDNLRKFILAHPEIKLVVCGHIHEAMGESSLEGVDVVNHGMGSDGHFVVIEVSKGESGDTKISHRSY